jgi:hypothetical protein
MTVPAFTNMEGYHEKKEWKFVHRQGVYFNVNVDDTYDDTLVTVSSSMKSPTAVGDHVRPLGYTREIVDVTVDEPFKYRQVFKPGNDVLWDLTWTENISTKYDFINILPPDQFRVWCANAFDECLTIARERLRDPKRRAHLGAAIITTRQTAREVARNATNILQAYKDLRNGNFAKAARQLGLSPKDIATGGSIADAWLQWIYGIKPMLADIHDECNQMVNTYRDEGFPITVSCIRKVSHQTEPSTTSTFNERWHCTGLAKVSYRANISNSYFDGLDESGVLNPLSILWEAVPFSFIVDWFVPVGNVLESLTATAGLDYAWGYADEVQESHFEAHLQHWGLPGVYTIVDPGVAKVGVYSFHRRTMSDFAMPALYAVGNPFSDTHVANAVALIRNMAGNSARLR